jgi:hypothetical protein
VPLPQRCDFLLLLEPLASDGMFQHFRPLYQGHLIANVDMTQERANRLIEAGLADSIAFGRRLLHLIRGLEAYPPPLIRGRNCT